MSPDDIPEDALSEKFLASTGPGGQNVNKVATACQLRVDVSRLGLAPHAYARLKSLAGSKMTIGGELIITARRFRTQEANREDARGLIITARRFRTQEANREDARARLAKLIADAHIVQARRKPTRPSKAARAKRVDDKKGRSAIKRGRGKVDFD